MTNIRRAATAQAQKLSHPHALVSNPFSVAHPAHLADHSKFVREIQNQLFSHLSISATRELGIAAMYHIHGNNRFSVSFSFTTSEAAQQLRAQCGITSYHGQGLYFNYQVTSPTQLPVAEDYGLTIKLGHGSVPDDNQLALFKHILQTEYGIDVLAMWQPRLDGLTHQPWISAKCRGKPNTANPVRHITWSELGDWGYMVYYDKVSCSQFPELAINPLPIHPTRGKWFSHIPPQTDNTEATTTDPAATTVSPSTTSTPPSTQPPPSPPPPQTTSGDASTTTAPQTTADTPTPDPPTCRSPTFALPPDLTRLMAENYANADRRWTRALDEQVRQQRAEWAAKQQEIVEAYAVKATSKRPATSDPDLDVPHPSRLQRQDSSSTPECSALSTPTDTLPPSLTQPPDDDTDSEGETTESDLESLYEDADLMSMFLDENNA